VTWTSEERDKYFDLARHAISYGVVSALEARKANKIPFKGQQLPPKYVNAGLSNIVTRTARLFPHWHMKTDPNNLRGTKQIVINPPPSNPAPSGTQPIPDRTNALWLDRARVFQTAMKDLTTDFGTVDLAINDITPEATPSGTTEFPPNYPLENSVNYCERQGRCNVGCLPGARHTLNKQLMVAALGKPDGTAPQFGNLTIEPLAEVDVIEALPEGGYVIHYVHQDPSNYVAQHEGKASRITTEKTVTADIVIVAAGCVGTSEIMLRSKERGTLPHLSDKTGFGFSTNGDYIAFLDKSKERVSLVRGPVTTSFGHFNTEEPGTGPDGPNSNVTDPSLFHTLEDQGIPAALASLLGQGVPLIKSLAKGREGAVFIGLAIFRFIIQRLKQAVHDLFTNNIKRGDFFKSEEEIAANMMCVVAMGREASVGQFTLGQGTNETSLRITRTDGKKFWDDPIYDAIRSSLDRLADRVRVPGTTDGFQNPFLTSVADAFNVESIALSHPLGGCCMAKDPAQGVVDEYGRVFNKTKTGNRPFYNALYIADASIIPTALGVNPSLTISALALRISDKMVEDLISQEPKLAQSTPG